MRLMRILQESGGSSVQHFDFKLSLVARVHLRAAARVRRVAFSSSLSWPVNSNARTREKAKEISKSRIPNFPVNLSGLVLFCIDTSDSESRRILQHFSRRT